MAQPPEWLELKINIPSVAKELEQLEISYTAEGNTK